MLGQSAKSESRGKPVNGAPYTSLTPLPNLPTDHQRPDSGLQTHAGPQSTNDDNQTPGTDPQTLGTESQSLNIGH